MIMNKTFIPKQAHYLPSTILAAPVKDGCQAVAQHAHTAEMQNNAWMPAQNWSRQMTDLIYGSNLKLTGG